VSQYEIGTLAVDVIIFATARRRLCAAAARPDPLLAVPNVTTHPSTASVPIIVLLYNGLLLCGFNVDIKGLSPNRKVGDLRDGSILLLAYDNYANYCLFVRRNAYLTGNGLISRHAIVLAAVSVKFMPAAWLRLLVAPIAPRFISLD